MYHVTDAQACNAPRTYRIVRGAAACRCSCVKRVLNTVLIDTCCPGLAPLHSALREPSPRQNAELLASSQIPSATPLTTTTSLRVIPGLRSLNRPAEAVALPRDTQAGEKGLCRMNLSNDVVSDEAPGLNAARHVSNSAAPQLRRYTVGIASPCAVTSISFSKAERLSQNDTDSSSPSASNFALQAGVATRATSMHARVPKLMVCEKEGLIVDRAVPGGLCAAFRSVHTDATHRGVPTDRA